MPDCAICYNDVKDPFRPSCCQHFFCRRCLIYWASKNNVCPLCKIKFFYVLPYNAGQLRVPMFTFAFYKNKRLYNLQNPNGPGLNLQICDSCGGIDQTNALQTCRLCNLYNCHPNCDNYCASVNSEFICEHCRGLLRMEFS